MKKFLLFTVLTLMIVASLPFVVSAAAEDAFSDYYIVENDGAYMYVNTDVLIAEGIENTDDWAIIAKYTDGNIEMIRYYIELSDSLEEIYFRGTDIERIYVWNLREMKSIATPVEIPAPVPESPVTFKVNAVDTINTDENRLILAYYETESSTRATELDISPDYMVYLNGKLNNSLNLDDIAAMCDSASLSDTICVKNVDGDLRYDVIEIFSYVHYVVVHTDSETFEVKTLDGNTLTLYEGGDIAISIQDIDGDALTFSDIKSGDVLAIMSDNIDSPTNPDKFIKIIDLGASSVEGEVTDWDRWSSKITINGTQYVVDPTAYNGDKANVGSEGIFYLGMDGQIVAFTKAPGNYAIIIETEENSSGFDEGYQVKVLNKNGEAIIYDVADKLTIRDADGYTQFFEVRENEKVDDLAGTTWEDLDGKGIADILSAFDDKVEGSDYEEIVRRTVKIEVDSSNEITEISPIALNKVEGSTTSSAEYNSAKFSGMGVVNSLSIIFSINNSDIDKSKVITVDSLANGAEYTVVGFDKDNGIYASAIIFAGYNTVAGIETGMAVVTGVAETVTEEDDAAYAIYFYENGKDELKTIIVTEDTLVDAAYNSTYTVGDREIGPDAMSLAADMGVGSLFLYSADADGYATVIASIANIEDDEFVPAAGMDFEKEPGRGSNKAKFYFGITTGKLTTDLPFYDVVRERDEEIVIEGATYKYRYNNASSRTRIEVGSYKGGNVTTATAGEGNYIFAREVDGEIVDIISIDSRVIIPN